MILLLLLLYNYTARVMTIYIEAGFLLLVSHNLRACYESPPHIAPVRRLTGTRGRLLTVADVYFIARVVACTLPTPLGYDVSYRNNRFSAT